MFSKSPIVVTGGAGFIGSNFVRCALRAGLRVVNLDALTYAGNLASLADVDADPNHDFHHVNICDTKRVCELLTCYQPKAILNFAAESHVDRSIERPGDFIQTNVVGTQRLLECALAYWDGLPPQAKMSFRYVQISTDEVFGSIESGQASEASPYAPNSPYAASKAAGDHLVRAFHRTYGLPAITTCSTNNYGPYQFPEKLIPLVILKAFAGEAIPLYGNGMQRRDWIHVLDHCSAILSILDRGRPGQAYNIGAGNERSNLEIVQEVCQALEERVPAPQGRPYWSLISFVPDRPGHDRRYALSCQRLENELGWRPRIALAEGLLETIAWYLENRSWVETIRRERYAGERLGLRAAW